MKMREMQRDSLDESQDALKTSLGAVCVGAIRHTTKLRQMECAGFGGSSKKGGQPPVSA